MKSRSCGNYRVLQCHYGVFKFRRSPLQTFPASSERMPATEAAMDVCLVMLCLSASKAHTSPASLLIPM